MGMRLIINVLLNTACKETLHMNFSFHRALLQPITFIDRLNALNYTKLRG